MAKRLSRLLLLLRLIYLDGFGRAKLLKKIKYFKSQGDGCYFGVFNFGTEPFLISFGDNVTVATGVKFVNHDMSADMISYIKYSRHDCLSLYGEIRIGSNVFIGANAIILPGVSIGSNVVIGAGAIIARSLESDGVYVGNGKLIGKFQDYTERVIQKSEQQRAIRYSEKLFDNGFCLRKK